MWSVKWAGFFLCTVQFEKSNDSFVTSFCFWIFYWMIVYSHFFSSIMNTNDFDPQKMHTKERERRMNNELWQRFMCGTLNKSAIRIHHIIKGICGNEVFILLSVIKIEKKSLLYRITQSK